MMKVIADGRRRGKTTALIYRSNKFGGYIVCDSIEECSRIFALAGEMKIDINFPISYSEFINQRYYEKGIKFFLIDNADLLLERIAFNVPIDSITVTTDD